MRTYLRKRKEVKKENRKEVDWRFIFVLLFIIAGFIIMMYEISAFEDSWGSKRGSLWIYLAVCLCFAGCGNIEEKQEASQELQNVQTPDEWSDDETVKEQDIPTDKESENAGPRGEKVEFLDSDRAWLQECCIYHGGGKEEVLLSEARGVLKVITEFVNETKADWTWSKSLDTVELKNPDELRDISEEKYYIYLQFYQPPIYTFEYGKEENFFINMSDKFIMEIDREKGEFFMNYKYDVDEGNIDFHLALF